VPRYYFHFRDGARIPDRAGQELPDAESARLNARRIAHELAEAGEAATGVIVVADGKQNLFEVSLGAFK
jgi:hypothetical protein